ncbi:hypothetical protein QWY99_21030 [Flavobacterium branchiarum]|uniref:Uncharacterized protein n=1 Tax=Flavobacterium branchiarum TaxID=1114870 RepID=A0ABV5FPH5_9FLAO|nr:hypothetical protein [Flavobacterium branchiarum]MDN3675520.1 hypothetical protein [Flavobacterium branchiarum]
MQTNKDLILRNIKKLSDFLMVLTKQKPSEIENIVDYINEFNIETFNLSTESLLEKETAEILEIVGSNNLEDIKDFADLLFFNFSLEHDKPKWLQQSEKIIELYRGYEKLSLVYSFEIQSKINILKKDS